MCQGFGHSLGFQKVLRPCALDKSSLSIRRVRRPVTSGRQLTVVLKSITTNILNNILYLIISQNRQPTTHNIKYYYLR